MDENQNEREDFPKQIVDELINNLGREGIVTGHVLSLRAKIDAVLAAEFSRKMSRLSNVISGSANQVARGTKVIKESLDQFQATTSESADKLCKALDAFRRSMDKSSGEMSRLTFWLVVFTALLAIFTAVVAVREILGF
jgi:hypothetical protein